MTSTWILVANSATARIFEIQKDGKLKEINALIHPESRFHGRDLTTDRPGRTHESANVGRHAMEPQTSLKREECIIFAKEISDYLHAAYLQGHFKRLYLAVAPQFLGLLRQAFPEAIAHAVAGEIDKDITHMSSDAIHKHLNQTVGVFNPEKEKINIKMQNR